MLKSQFDMGNAGYIRTALRKSLILLINSILTPFSKATRSALARICSLIRISKFIRIIKDSDLLRIQKRGHTLSKAPSRDSLPQDKAIIAGKNSQNLFFILFSNQFFPPSMVVACSLFYNAMDEYFTNFLVPACPG